VVGGVGEVGLKKIRKKVRGEYPGLGESPRLWEREKVEAAKLRVNQPYGNISSGHGTAPLKSKAGLSGPSVDRNEITQISVSIYEPIFHGARCLSHRGRNAGNSATNRDMIAASIGGIVALENPIRIAAHS